MQAENVKEYLEIRKEVAELKSCITTYVGFAVGGSATAVWALAGRTSHGPIEDTAAALAAILLALVSVFVLFLLSYKFFSHNRYVGYSKLLTHEEFREKCANPSDVFLWEISLDRLRGFSLPHPSNDADKTEKRDADKSKKGKKRRNDKLESLHNYCDEVQPWTFGVDNLKDRVDEHVQSKPVRSKLFYALALLLLGRGEKPGSWKFPVYVARIFAAIDVIFVVFAVYFLHAFSLGTTQVALAVLTLILALSWLRFLVRLHDLMSGNETVESFCWQFVPIRAKLLRDFDPQLEYRLKAVAPANTQAKGAAPS